MNKILLAPPVVLLSVTDRLLNQPIPPGPNRSQSALDKDLNNKIFLGHREGKETKGKASLIISA